MSPPDTLPLIDAALRGAFVAVVLLLAGGLARSRSGHPGVHAGLCLMLGLAVQTVSGLPQLEAHAASLWQAPLVGVSVGNSMLFWLFTRALFDDDFVLRRRHLALWVAVFTLGSSFYLTVAPPRIDAWFTPPLAIAMRWTPVLFGLLALAATVSQWRADLVERRRRLRLFILLAGSAYTLVMAALRLSTPHGRLTELSASLDVAALLAILASVAVAVLRVSTPLLPEDPVAPGLAPPPFPPASASADAPTTATATAPNTLPHATGPAASDPKGAPAPWPSTASPASSASSSSSVATLAPGADSVAPSTTTSSRQGEVAPDREQDKLA